MVRYSENLDPEKLRRCGAFNEIQATASRCISMHDNDVTSANLGHRSPCRWSPTTSSSLRPSILRQGFPLQKQAAQIVKDSSFAEHYARGSKPGGTQVDKLRVTSMVERSPPLGQVLAAHPSTLKRTPHPAEIFTKIDTEPTSFILNAYIPPPKRPNMSDAGSRSPSPNPMEDWENQPQPQPQMSPQEAPRQPRRGRGYNPPQQQQLQQQQFQQPAYQQQQGGALQPLGPQGVGNAAGQAGQLLGNTLGQVTGSEPGKKSDTLKLRLDLNLDVDVQIKARVHGDVTLSLL